MKHNHTYGVTVATSKANAAKAKNAAKATNAATQAKAAQAATSDERILAIDVGGTGLKAAIIDADGKMQTERLVSRHRIRARPINSSMRWRNSWSRWWQKRRPR